MLHRALLVDVEFDKGAGEKGQLQTRWTHHPLGLMSLAANARKRFPDVQFRVLHSVTCESLEESLARELRDFRPDLVGLRSLSLFQKQFAAAARVVRETSPEVPLIGGGPYPSASHKYVLEQDLVDQIVFEEGEPTFNELLACLADQGRLPDALPGTIVRSGGDIRVNPSRPLVANLDELELPDYGLIELSDYDGFSNHAFQSASSCAFVETSRGCPYRCYYCHVANVPTVRRRSAEHVLREMEAHYNVRGIRDFVFVDDIFNVPLPIAKEILRRVAARLPGVRLNFPNGLRADQMDDEFLDLLEACGTVHLALAIETATPRLQKLCGKFMRLDKAQAMVHKASRRFVTCTFFMIGFPTETREEAWATIRYAQELDHVVQPVLSIVRVYPGTPVFAVLDASEEQARRLEQQTAMALQPRLYGDPSFYGDIFSDEQVPLKSADIQELRFEWMRQVIGNPARVRNSHAVVERHFGRGQMLEFYRNLFDNRDFDEAKLERMLSGAAQNARPPRTADASVAATLG